MPRFFDRFARQDEALLVELPASAKPLQFDEEEAHAIQIAWPRGFIDQPDRIVTDMGFTIDGERAASFKKDLAADALASVADSRLSPDVVAFGVCIGFANSGGPPANHD